MLRPWLNLTLGDNLGKYFGTIQTMPAILLDIPFLFWNFYSFFGTFPKDVLQFPFPYGNMHAKG